MWVTGHQDIEKIPEKSLNQELLEITGEMDNETARITLAKFLRGNLKLACELLLGINIEKFQEVTLKGFFARNFNMLIWARGASKTISYHNDNQLLIEKQKGLINLKNLIPDVDFSKGERWVDIPNLSLWNGNEYADINKVLIQPQKNCFKIKTERGYELIGSENHLIKVLENKDKTCKIVWKRFHQLADGDLVCIDRNPINYTFEEPDQKDKDEAYLIGLLIGDGCYSKGSRSGMSITSEDDWVLDFCAKFTDLDKKYKKNTKNTHSINFRQPFVKYLLDKYEIERSTSYFKKIPAKILANSYLLKECLAGLFDSDGYVSSRIVGIGQTSELLARQIQTALLTYGVISSLSLVKTNSNFGKAFVVKVEGENLDKFQKVLHFKLKRKQDKLNSLIGKKRNTNIDVIPGLIECANDIKKNTFVKHGQSKWKHGVKSMQLGRKNATYKILDRYIEAFDGMNCTDPRFEDLKEIKKENYFFDKIKSMTPSIEDCLDFNIPCGERYWANGFINHNSWLTAVFCILQCIFEPGTKIVIASANFRTARRLFMEVDKLLNANGAYLARQCFLKTNKRNDEYLMPVAMPGGGTIIAVPLSGENLRGYRASVLIVDEFLLVPKDTVERVLMPFLNSPLDVAERIRVREIEDDMIRNGSLKESERMAFKNMNKMMILSSASYTFEYLYETYALWSDIIENPELLANTDKVSEDAAEIMKDSTYFISQLSYQYLPEHMLDAGAIQLAKNGGMSQSAFDREYRAIFVDGGDGYFSPKKMLSCTIANGEYPTTKAIGDPGKKYILAIDPSLSASKTSDYFAMSIIELDEEKNQGILVHGYQKAGASIQDHIKYLYYVLKHFNIVFIIIDHAGGDQFIEAANGSALFTKNDMTLDFVDFNSDTEGHDYILELQKLKDNYNVESRKICYKRFFTSNFLRRANEYLQSCIDHKRIWFASQASAHEDTFAQIQRLDNLPFELIFPKGIEDAPDDAIEKMKVGIRDFIEQQDFILRDTKEQCALIQVTTTSRGTQSFDMPNHLRRLNTATKPRKDNYSTLMLANWATRCYFDLFSEKSNKGDGYYEFEPFFV